MQRAANWVMVIFFLGFVVSVGILTAWNTKLQSRAENLSIVKGEWAGAQEREVDESLPIRSLAISFWAAIDYFIFGEARRGASVGKDGWLFTDEELHSPDNAQSALQHNIGFIRNVERYLSSQNITLLVALLPAKANIYSDHLAETPSEFMHSLFAQSDQLLIGLDHVIDMREHFESKKSEQRLFLKTDTHWTPEGAYYTAELLARHLKETALDYQTKSFSRQPQQKLSLEGDLLSYLPLSPFFDQWGPEHEEVALYETVSEEDMGLFGDSETEFSLVGTSYSANRNWGFEGALKERLQADVVNFAQEGKGPFEPMMDYLLSSDFEAYPPRYVIWEIPIRYMPMTSDVNDNGLFKKQEITKK